MSCARSALDAFSHGDKRGRALVGSLHPPGSAFNRRKAEDKENREIVAEAIATVVGTPLRPVFATLDADPSAEAAPEAGGAAEVGENELVERFISEFDAEVLIDDEPDRSGSRGQPDEPDQPDERIEETS